MILIKTLINDLRELWLCLNAYKIALNVGKPGFILLKINNKTYNVDLKIKVRIRVSLYDKYLGVFINGNLN